MGSVSLIVATHEGKDRAVLQRDHGRHQRQIVRAGLKADPTLALKMQELLTE
jgi:hypothetical protein